MLFQERNIWKYLEYSKDNIPEGGWRIVVFLCGNIACTCSLNIPIKLLQDSPILRLESKQLNQTHPNFDQNLSALCTGRTCQPSQQFLLKTKASQHFHEDAVQENIQVLPDQSQFDSAMLFWRDMCFLLTVYSLDPA